MHKSVGALPLLFHRKVNGAFILKKPERKRIFPCVSNGDKADIRLCFSSRKPRDIARIRFTDVLIAAFCQPYFQLVREICARKTTIFDIERKCVFFSALKHGKPALAFSKPTPERK